MQQLSPRNAQFITSLAVQGHGMHLHVNSSHRRPSPHPPRRAVSQSSPGSTIPFPQKAKDKVDVVGGDVALVELDEDAAVVGVTVVVVITGPMLMG
jgi:hypothetical protein